MKEEDLTDEFLKKLIQSIELSPSEGFVDRVMYRLERRSVYFRVVDWLIEKQTTLVLKMTYSILNPAQKFIDDYHVVVNPELVNISR